MGKIMDMISGFINARRTRQLQRTERLEEINKVRQDIDQAASAIKQQVHRYQQEDDPLQALMNVLQSPRNHH